MALAWRHRKFLPDYPTFLTTVGITRIGRGRAGEATGSGIAALIDGERAIS